MKRKKAISGQQSAVSGTVASGKLKAEGREPNASPAFTLIELLASIAILGLMVVLLFAAFNQASKAWLLGENRVETFTQARAALDFMAKELSQTMAGTNVHFLANLDSLAFVAPVNDDPNSGPDLMEVVYRLSHAIQGNPSLDPTGVFTNTTPPYRLVRRASAHQSPQCVDYGTGATGCPNPWDFYQWQTWRNWPQTSDPTKTAVLAENIISLTFLFFDVAGTTFSYWNSTDAAGWCQEIGGADPCVGFKPPNQPDPLLMTNRAPAGVQITIGAIDSRAAARLRLVTFGTPVWSNIVNEATQYFTTFVSVPNRQP